MRKKNKITKEKVYMKLSKVTGDKVHLCFNEADNEIIVCCNVFKRPIYI